MDTNRLHDCKKEVVVDGVTRHQRISETKVGKCSLDLEALPTRLPVEPKGQSLSLVGQEGSGGGSLAVRADGGSMAGQVDPQGRLERSG